MSFLSRTPCWNKESERRQSAARRRFFQPCMEALEDRLVPAIEWIASGGGEWNVPANWRDPVTLQNRTPISTDDVSLPMDRDYTCTAGVCNSVSVGSGTTFTVIGGSGLNILGDASFGGTLMLDSGLLIVGGNAVVSDDLTLQGANSQARFSATGTTTIGADVEWSGSGSISGGSDANPIAVSHDMLITGTDNKTLFGILRSSGAAIQEGLANLTISNFGKFINTGTYEVHGDGDISGQFINDGTAATLSKTAGTGVTRMSGAVNLGGHVVGHTGRLDFQMGFMPSFDLDVTADAGAVVAFDTTGSGTGRLHGTLTAAGPGRVLIDAPLQVGGGDLVLAVSGDVLEWLSSQIVAQQGTLTNTGTVRLTGVGGQNYLGTVINTGTFRHENTQSFGGSGTFHNSGTFEYTTDGRVASGTFENTGVVRKSAGAGTSRMEANFVNLGGHIDVLTGTLATQGVGAIAVGGDFHVETGAVLDMPGGTLTGTFTGSGGGVVRTRGSVFTAGAGGATFNLPPGMLQVNRAGTFNGGTNGFTIAADSDLTIITGGGIAINGLFINNGDIYHQGVVGSGPVTLNGTLENNGLYVMAPGTSLSGSGDFVNLANGLTTGILRKDHGPANTTISAQLSNPGGRIEVLSGQLQLFRQLVNEGGHVFIGSGATLQIPVIPDYTQTAGGATTLDGGTLHVFSTAGADIQSGTLEGTGTVIGNVTNAGTVSPGASPGAITINGNYTQTATGTLEIEMAGTVPGAEYDQLLVNGTVTLGGALARSTSFTPALGQVFRMIDNNLSDVVAGTFAGLPPGALVTIGSAEFQVSYSGGTGNDVTLTVVGFANSPPTAHAGGPYAISEGDSLTLDASASSDPDGDTLTYSWDFDGDGIGEVPGLSPTLSWSDLQALGIDDGPMSWDVRVIVSDGNHPPVPSAPVAISVSDLAPTIALGGDAAATEGLAFTLLLGSVTDPGADTVTAYMIDWGDSQVETVATAGAATHTYADGPAIRMIVVSLVNEDGTHSGAGMRTISVFNSAPSAGVSGPASAVRGETCTFTVTAQDVAADMAAGFTYLFDWDDGNPPTEISPTPGNDAGVSVDHAFVAAGTYAVRVSAVDKDGRVSAPATLTVTVTNVALRPDPLNPGQLMLVVGGTPGDDVISLRPGAAAGAVVVRMNGIREGAFLPTSRLVVHGYDGNDRINVLPRVTQPAWLYGGAGNDRVTAGGGPAVILGGDGDDILRGRDARDLLIGGLGADHLRGGRDDDLLIAGFTTFDDDEAALAAIQAAWLAMDTYGNRLANVRTVLTTEGTGRSVFDDGAADMLIGNRGLDAYFADRDTGTLDEIFRRDAGETAVDTD